MDLKTSYVSVQTDFGSMNGRVRFVMFLRKQHLVIYHE